MRVLDDADCHVRLVQRSKREMYMPTMTTSWCLFEIALRNYRRYQAYLVGRKGYILPAALLRGGRLSQSVVRSAGAFAIFTGSYLGLRGVMEQE
jgi:hypothetical protein